MLKQLLMKRHVFVTVWELLTPVDTLQHERSMHVAATEQ